MEYQIDRSFIKDTKKAPLAIQQQVALVLAEIRNADKIRNLAKIKKLSGSRNAFRIRIDDYRIGFYLEGKTIVLSRLLARKEIYRYFPQK